MIDKPRQITLLAVVLGLSTLSCRNSEPLRRAENQAFAEFVDYCIELAKMRHACNPEQEATIEALMSGTEALRENMLNLYESYAKQYELADAAEKACRQRLPSLAEQEQKYRKLAVAWSSSCLGCASEKKCGAMQRKLRELDESDLSAFEDNMLRLKATPVCD